ncbi:MAG TPA: NUDIX domain-containing protein [Candidatus Saccharimonadales bacterium]|jgi:8-oxo-dGTP pyrophosphatase MutT (NUDIX family)
MPASKISIDEAKKDKLFYFVANLVVYREEDGRCLILKRSENETAHPGKWAVPGGKMEWTDFDITKPTRINGDILDFENSVEGLLVRETLEEANIKVENDFTYLNSVTFIRPDEVPVVLVKFAARYKSGQAKPEEGAFTDVAWVNVEEIKKYDCIDGVPEEIARTIKLMES